MANNIINMIFIIIIVIVVIYSLLRPLNLWMQT